MFNSLCLLLFATLCWQYVFSRHVVLQPFYLPYSDYSYTYSGPGPSYQQHHSPFFSPPGTYFDQRQGIFRPFPGGGVPVLVDYHKRCSNQYVGLKAHPDQQQYYYVCKPECVIFGKCQNLQIFNATSGQCAQHPPPEYKPTCTEVGRFPLFSDCHLYYKCEEDLQPKIYSCPQSMVFSPASKKCINGNKCTPTQISPHSSYIPEFCANKFPPCFENGIFRSPSDCSLYYKCDLKNDGFYLQTRLRCPHDYFFDLQKNECLPSKEVPCDCIQVAELVYPKPNNMPFQPAMYPAQFDLDSFEEGQYPVEQTKEELNNNSNISHSRQVIDIKREMTTTLDPTTLSIEQDDIAILSDYIDIGDDVNKLQSQELEELTTTATETAISAEESPSAENFNVETDTAEAANLHKESRNATSSAQLKNEIGNSQEITNVVTTDAEIDSTDNIHNHTEDYKNISTDGILTDTESETETTNFAEIETTTVLQERNDEEQTTTTGVSSRSMQPKPCKSFIEGVESNFTDTHNNDTSQTQTKKCLPLHTTTNQNIDLRPTKNTFISENTPDSRSTLHEQNSTIIITPVKRQLSTTQFPIETISANNKINSVSSLLESKTKPEAVEAIQFSEESKLARVQIPRTPDTRVKKTHDVKTLLHATSSKSSFEEAMELAQLTYTDPSQTNTIVDDIFDEMATKANDKAIVSAHTMQFANGPELTIEDTKINSQSSIENFAIQSSRIPVGSQKLQKIKKTLKFESAPIKKTHTATNQNKNTSFDGSINNSTDFTTEDKFALLNAKSKLDKFGALTQTQENFVVNPLFHENPLITDSSKNSNHVHISTNEKSVKLRQVDLSDEGFIPVHIRSKDINELPEETTDFEERFNDDYTTISTENEFTTTAATAIKGAITQQQQQNHEPKITLRRRQTSLDEATQPTTVKGLKQIALAEHISANNIVRPNTSADTEGNSFDENSYEDLFDDLDTEVVIHDHSDEVSNNKITSAETTQTDSNSKQEHQFPHTPLTTFIPTQTSTTTNKSKPSETQTNNLVLHVRESNPEQAPLDFLPSKSLYYILKTKPVMSNNDSNTNNNTVTAPPSIEFANGNIPRLEIIAERPIDVRLSICPSSCDKNHKHKNSTASKRAVLLKWFANKSKQTLGFETANELNVDGNSEC